MMTFLPITIVLLALGVFGIFQLGKGIRTKNRRLALTGALFLAPIIVLVIINLAIGP